jgi:hypothetical protein
MLMPFGLRIVGSVTNGALLKSPVPSAAPEVIGAAGRGEHRRRYRTRLPVGLRFAAAIEDGISGHRFEPAVETIA